MATNYNGPGMSGIKEDMCWAGLSRDIDPSSKPTVPPVVVGVHGDSDLGVM